MDKPVVDVLFIHSGKPYGSPPISVPPIGLIALANYLKRAGLQVIVCNAAVETELNSGFDATALAAQYGARIICLDLHWHYQSFSVITLARRLKQSNKNCAIILGGFTATHFHKEILKNYPEIDFIVRGDAEKPLLELVRALISGGKAFSAIPNLTWRAGKRTHANPLSYSADKALFNSLEFSDFDVYIHWQRAYPDIETFGLLREGRLAPGKAAEILAASRVFYYNCGRGCTRNCVFCGGGRKAHKTLCNRRTLLMGSLPAVLRQLTGASKAGFINWHTDFFPEGSYSYYKKLFKAIKRAGLRFNLTFGCWHLPDQAFLKLLSETFLPGSTIEISPDSGSERLRRRIGKAYYSNSQLLALLKSVRKLKLKCFIHFTAGLPYEGKKELLETLKLIDTIKTTCPGQEIVAESIDLEPTSPLFNAPVKHKCALMRRSFHDFYIDSSDAKKHLGYATQHFSEQAIQRLIKMLRLRCQPDSRSA